MTIYVKIINELIIKNGHYPLVIRQYKTDCIHFLTGHNTHP